MADEKPKGKDAPKDKPKAKGTGLTQSDVFSELLPVILGFILLSSIVTGITNTAHNDPLFRNGWKGLTPHGITLAYTRPLASVLNPIGSAVLVSKDSIAVLNDAGGLRVGSQSFGTKGKVLQGPVQVGGIHYYKVDFDTGVDGWVNENDIAYIDGQPSALAKIILFIWKIIFYMKYILLLCIVALIFFLAKIVRALTKIRVNNREKLYPVLAVTDPKVSQNPKWERVLTHIESINENDWRLAIIEADIMLAELLDTMHLVGDSIGEKMKGIEKSDFTTLDLAWEAHKVRNQIAHAGGDFRITQREALRIIELYSKVFKEFQYI